MPSVVLMRDVRGHIEGKAAHQYRCVYCGQERRSGRGIVTHVEKLHPIYKQDYGYLPEVVFFRYVTDFLDAQISREMPDVVRRTRRTL